MLVLPVDLELLVSGDEVFRRLFRLRIGRRDEQTNGRHGSLLTLGILNGPLLPLGVVEQDARLVSTQLHVELFVSANADAGCRRRYLSGWKWRW